MRNLDKRHIAAATAVLAVVTAGYWVTRSDGGATSGPQATAADPGHLSEVQIRQLGIRLEPAREAGAAPVGTVPGVVSLPPEARVAVTSPFAGTALRILVIQGEVVSAGQPLAVVRAAETVQFGAELSRAQADLGVSRAAADRLALLAREGVVAGARADEARAMVNRNEATIRENRRLLAMAGASGDGTVTLRAPIAGRVATVAIDAGAAVGGGGAAPFVIENDAALMLDLQVPERLAAQLRPGMTVELATAAGASATITGRLLSVATSLDPVTRSVAAKASLSAASGLVPGKGVMAIISGNAGDGKLGVSVPSVAVTRVEGQDYVFVRNGSRFVRRRVVVAAEVGGRSVLSAGLKPGEPVAISGVAELKSLLAGQ
ncbi:efflux RND transporter periplasmic adaptor subunit [Novosphingobium sp.]|uniref:efflux RND transporter periplasmic adaptor subunit n=1 Tax=Novosphingobium sp. TaxID=1874826 RepID=UPI00286DF500|nr:efflux RND transporter periplasmic adaptor subunit [Novosphingobium sp.]